jgi:hypothetical protein
MKHRFCEASARRGGRYPMRAPTVAVGLAGRLRCDARSAVAPRNSLHSLRSLRSDSLGESDERSALLRFSPPHKSPPPGTAHRTAALVVFEHACHDGAGKAGGGCAPVATYAAPRNGSLAAARDSALRVLTRRDCSSEANAVSAASFATGRETEYRREPSAQRRAAAFERRRTPARGFACSASARRGQVDSTVITLAFETARQRWSN